ncbi:MAG: C25 family cysteine peptidase, partial [Lentimicrobiaceae bacterium]|nr:C25 family cysteine peptidase [Lentimicrobiaceae bacterium]
MKKILMTLIAATLAFAVNAQTIALRTSNTGISKSNDRFTGFEASFSYNQIEAVTITGTQRGTFSVLNIEGAIMGGDFGTPQLPVFRKMIQVPVGATPKVIVKNFTTTEYSLEEYGAHRIFPRQPDIRKDWDINDIPFIYDEKAYSIDDFTQSAIAEVNILGTMRGVIIGVVDVHPVQYNPVTQTILVHNDIEVEVVFENANRQKTEELLVGTYSPYFKDIYKVLFNSGVTRDLYDDRPDLYNTPVHMLVIAHRMFEATLQPWIEWKTQKGFIMDVNYTDVIGTTAAQIKTFCHNKYNQGVGNGTAPTFIIFVGDVQQVAASQTGSQTQKATDLYYATLDAGYFPSMYYSRMSAQTVQQLQNIIEKTLYYEKYQFADPTYLDNVLLIAGADAGWAPRLGRPQINYAADHYYNTANGYANIHKYTTSNYTGCYTNLNNVGFANFTAHCGETLWSDPDLTVTMVKALTNVNKYYVAMGNCCLAADFGYNECIGEAMVRESQKGAVGYIGSSPNSYWFDDFHFTVGAYSGIGATSSSNPAAPTLTNTQTGCYDFMFRDADHNTLCSHVFGGNVSVTFAHITSGYDVHTSNPRYYWEAYNVLGDGSLMPYNGQAADNSISHLPVIYIGLPTYEVMAAPGSYVAISKDGVLLGTALANEAGVATVTLDPPITSGGNVCIVVTRNQYKPYINETIPAVAQSGPYIVSAGYTVPGAEILTYTSTNSEIIVTLKNVGIETCQPLNVTITCDDSQLTINNGTATCSGIAPDGTTTVSFNVTVANDVIDGKTFSVDLTATEGSKTSWGSKLMLKAFAPKFSLEKVLINGVEDGNLEKGTVVTITAIVENKGGADAFNVEGDLETNSPYIIFACADEIIQTGKPLPAGETMELVFTVVTDPEMPYGHEANFELLLTAQYGRTGMETFSASCAGSNNYCSPGSTDCSDGDMCSSVILYKTSEPSVLLINNPNITCVSGGYYDFTDLMFPLEPGEQYTIKLKKGQKNYTNHIRGWFDVNGNNIFDSNEQLISLSFSQANQEVTETFTIPQVAVPGTHRFRLVTKFSSAPGACNNSSYGQTIDYSFIIPEQYPRVQNVEAVLLGSDIAVTWEAPEEGTPVGYNIYRNSECLNAALLTTTNFTEENVEQGVYAYNVTAVYEGNKESFAERSNIICNFDPTPKLCEKPIEL